MENGSWLGQVESHFHLRITAIERNVVHIGNRMAVEMDEELEQLKNKVQQMKKSILVIQNVIDKEYPISTQ